MSGRMGKNKVVDASIDQTQVEDFICVANGLKTLASIIAKIVAKNTSNINRSTKQ